MLSEKYWYHLPQVWYRYLKIWPPAHTLQVCGEHADISWVRHINIYVEVSLLGNGISCNSYLDQPFLFKDSFKLFSFQLFGIIPLPLSHKVLCHQPFEEDFTTAYICISKSPVNHPLQIKIISHKKIFLFYATSFHSSFHQLPWIRTNILVCISRHFTPRHNLKCFMLFVCLCAYKLFKITTKEKCYLK